MRAFTIFLVILVPLTAGAQITFVRTYGDTLYQEGYSVDQTSDGGYVITGWTETAGPGAQEVYLVRTDSWGDTLWTRTYGGSQADFGRSVEQTGDGGYIIAGETQSFGPGDYDIYLIKTDASGDTVGTRTYGGSDLERGHSVRQTNDGGYVIAGYTRSFGAGNVDVYLIRTDAVGDTVWTRTFGGSSYDYGLSVDETADGGYVIAGHSDSFGAGGFDVYLVRTDAAGGTLWTRTYGGSGHDYGCSVERTADGGFIVAGYTDSFGAGSADLYLVRTDGAGDTVWTRAYGGSEWDMGRSATQTGDGGYIVTGATNSFGAAGGDLYLVKTDSSGDTVWTRMYGTLEYDSGESIQATGDGGYIIAGYTGPGLDQLDGDVYVIKTDADGLVGVNHPPDLVDQADTTVAENQYLTFTLEATDPEFDSLAFSSPDLPVGATLDEVSGLFEWTPTSVQSGLYVVTFIATDFGEPALADTEQTEITVTDAVGVADDEDEVRLRARYLAQNRPNPFASSTTIVYSLRARRPVSMRVYDIRGALVCEIVNEAVSAGVHRVTWDGRDAQGREVGSGVYFCRMQAGEFSETRRMVLLR
jgi:hypothetical protein